MATSKKVGGKVIYLRESVREQWRSQNLRQGYDKLTDSEFVEVLLQ